MTHKASNTKEFELAAARKRMPVEAVSSEAEGESAPSREMQLKAHFGIALLQDASARAVQRIPISLLAPATHPECRQPRLLPRLDELVVNGQPVPLYASMVAMLLELGHSLQKHQIQPIIAYRGTDDRYPSARYLILVGHRRWTAAQLVGLSDLDVIIIDEPSPIERIALQYAENEDRADFTDMERAWALNQMKQALGETARWELVEERLQISRTRRQELLRLLEFSNEQQELLAQLRISETQIRPLHQALRNHLVSKEQVDTLFQRFTQLGVQVAANAEASLRPAVDGPTIARLVAKAKRETLLGSTPATSPWAKALLDQLTRTTRSLKSARRRFPTASDTESAQLQAAIVELSTLLMAIEHDLRSL